MRKLSCGVAIILVMGLGACQDTGVAPDSSLDELATARKNPKPEPPPDDDGGSATVAPTIVFSESARRGGPVVFFMDADGNRGEALADGEQIKGTVPRWSPDGTGFVYTQEVTFKKAPSEIRLMVATLDPGSDTWSVAQVPTSITRVGFESDWSPHGWLLFNDFAGNIWTIRPDGSGESQLTFDGEAWDHALWSRDGSSVLAHVHDGTGYSLRIYSVDCSSGTCAQAGAPTEILLTDLGLDPLDDVAPLDWAHNSDRLLCAMGTSSGWDLGILDLSDPGNPTLTNLTASPDAGESAGAWSPDDSKIVHGRWTFDRAPAQLLIRDVSTGAITASVEADVSHGKVDWNPVPPAGS
jgi:Tol biopolymer transport system component